MRIAFTDLYFWIALIGIDLLTFELKSVLTRRYNTLTYLLTFNSNVDSGELKAFTNFLK